MKKRILCFLLSLLLLLSLAPGALPQAGAVSRSTSDFAIELVQALEGFRAKAYQVDGQWRIGYGTPAKEGDIITQATAATALKAELNKLDKAVSQFSITVRRDFTQYEHDALVLYSFRCGTSWMTANDRFREAISSKDTGNEFLTSITLSAMSGGRLNKTVLNRRLIEANLFLNGLYNTTPPGYYAYVLLDGNGGTLSGDTLIVYNTNLMASLETVPTLSGSRFMGWYTGKTGGDYVTTLDSKVGGMTLYAHWQQEGQGETGGKVEGTPASYTLSASQAASLKVYETPDTSSKVLKTLIQNAQMSVVAEYVDAKNVKWVKLKSGGWVSLGNVEKPQPSVKPVAVKVTTDSLNVREQPGAYAYHKIVKRVPRGETLYILDTAVEAGQQWGRCADGWVCLMYTDYEQVVMDSDIASGVAVATGVVSCSSVLKIRSGTGTYYSQVGTLKNGTKVVIYEFKNGGGREWARISAGWICMEYVVLDKDAEPDQGGNDSGSTGGTGNTNTVIANGTVTNTYVNYRSGPGTQNAYLGKLYKGDKIKLYEITNVGTKRWGRFDKGWVCLDYVKVDMLQSEEQKPQETPTKYWTAVANAQLAVYDEAGKKTDQIIKQDQTVRVYGLGSRENETQILAKVGQGYVLAKYLTFYIAEETSQLIAEANLYSRPGGTASGKTLAAGTTVTVTRMQLLDEYTFVYVESAKGWIDADLLAAFSGNPGGEESTTPEETQPTEPEQTKPTEPEETEPTEPEETKPEDTEPQDPVPEGARQGIVVGAEKVNVRSSAGVRFDNLVTTLKRGTKVNVYETIFKDGAQWGRIDQGWISMRYVQLNVNNGNGSQQPVARGFVNGTVNLNVRSGPGMNYTPVTTLAPGTEINIYEHQLTAGTIWGRTDAGWVSMHYVTLIATGGSTDEEGTGEGSVMGTIARCYYAVNVRSAPGTGNTLVGKILVGTRVEIYEQVQKGAVMWGRVDQGWISMDYVLLDSELPPPGEFENGGATEPAIPLPTVPKDAIYLGSVIGTKELNVRATASTNGEKMGTLKKGDSIVIYETTITNTMAWGRCDQGWVSLVYIDLVSCTENAEDARVVQSINTVIRNGPGYTYSKLGTYTKGTVIDIFEIDGNWLRTDIGWVSVYDLLA